MLVKINHDFRRYERFIVSPNITFVDLQYTDTTDEELFKKKYGVEIVRLEEIDNLNDIDGLASLIDACDFVVSVSNTTAHISGAIGKKLINAPKKQRSWYWSKKMQRAFGISQLRYLSEII